MNQFATGSTDPVEKALAAYERHQDAQPAETDTQRDKTIEGIANYIQMHLLKERGVLNQKKTAALNYWGLLLAEQFDEESAEFLGRLAMEDPHEAGMSFAKTAESLLLEVAEQYRDDLEEDARCWGYLDQ